MPYWNNKADTRSLWFDSGRWKIGSKTNTGTWTSRIKSYNIALPCPESDDNIKWKVKNGEGWTDAGSDTKVLINPGKTADNPAILLHPYLIKIVIFINCLYKYYFHIWDLMLK